MAAKTPMRASLPRPDRAREQRRRLRGNRCADRQPGRRAHLCHQTAGGQQERAHRRPGGRTRLLPRRGDRGRSEDARLRGVVPAAPPATTPLEGEFSQMQIGSYTLGIGGIIAVIVLVLAILGMLSVIPNTAVVLFGLIAALAVARLIP